MCKSKLTLSNINKNYKEKKVLKNLNLNVHESERLSILGPSGCGKSTLLRIIAGLESDFTGTIYMDKSEINNIPTNKRNIVMVTQENYLFLHLNVFENIAFPMRARKVDNKKIKEKVTGLLEEIKLSGYENKKVNQLSGGEKQRIALARALAAEPDVLLLDEAYSSLDANLRIAIRELTMQLQKKHNITTILVTHDKEEAMSFSNRVGVMLNGEIKQLDTPKNVYENPIDAEVAKFLITDNHIDYRTAYENKLIEKLNDNVKSVLIHPQDIEISEEKTEITAEIVDSRYTLKKIRYFCKITNMTIEVDDNSEKEYDVGEKIYLKIKKYRIFEKEKVL